MRIEIIDAASRYVKDARVQIEYLMLSLPGKPPMTVLTLMCLHLRRQDKTAHSADRRPAALPRYIKEVCDG